MNQLITRLDLVPENCKKFKIWLETAKPGEIYIYHRGEPLSSFRYQLPIKELTWKYAVKGEVYLFQKKVSTFDFDHVAQKAGIRNKKLIPLDYWSDKWLRKMETESK